MPRVVALASCLLVALAGCPSSPDAMGPPTASSSAASTQPAPALAPTPTTDTLFLLDPPHMAGTAPNGAEIRSPVPSFTDSFTGAFVDQTSAIGQVWTAPRNGLGVLEGNATIWVEVKGTVGNPGGPRQGCFWSIFLRADEDSGGGFSGTYADCIPEESVLVPGVRELRVGFRATDVSAVVGSTISLSISSAGVYGPDGSIEVLSGSAQHPSRLSVRGLSLPLDTQTLLV